MNSHGIIASIDYSLNLLSGPLTVSDIDAGWTSNSVDAIESLLDNVKRSRGTINEPTVPKIIDLLKILIDGLSR